MNYSGLNNYGKFFDSALFSDCNDNQGMNEQQL